MSQLKFTPRLPTEVFALIKKFNKGEIPKDLNAITEYFKFWNEKNYLLSFNTSFISNCRTVFLIQWQDNKSCFAYFPFPEDWDLPQFNKNEEYEFTLPNGVVISTNFKKLRAIALQLPFLRETYNHLISILEEMNDYELMSEYESITIEDTVILKFYEGYGFFLETIEKANQTDFSLAVHTVNPNRAKDLAISLLQNINAYLEKEEVCIQQFKLKYDLTKEELALVNLMGIQLYPTGEFDLHFSGHPYWEYVGGLFNQAGEFMGIDFGNY